MKQVVVLLSLVCASVLSVPVICSAGAPDPPPCCYRSDTPATTQSQVETPVLQKDPFLTQSNEIVQEDVIQIGAAESATIIADDHYKATTPTAKK